MIKDFKSYKGNAAHGSQEARELRIRIINHDDVSEIN